MKLANFVHILIKIIQSQFIFQIKKDPRMIYKKVTTQLYPNIIPISNLMNLMYSVIFDPHQHISDITVPSPQQPEPIWVVNDQIISQTHP